MPPVTSFPPIARADARILILGSMPGLASLAAGRYYAHPSNSFWSILGSIAGFSPTADYQLRVGRLHEVGIAVWDVLQQCERNGSLDSAIDRSSEVANDFAPFFDAHPLLQRIVFNGAKAQQCFARHVQAHRPVPIELVRVPSTSPAHAGMPVAEKRARWLAALQRDQL